MDKLEHLYKKYEAFVKLLWDMEAIGQAQNQEDHSPSTKSLANTNPPLIYVDSPSKVEH